MSSAIRNKHFVLTGRPGIGKTTIIQVVSDLLKQANLPVLGFYTEEIRKYRERVGFDIVNVDGRREPLARLTEPDESISDYTIGKYSVFLNEFESIAIPMFYQARRSPESIVVIDEIGKMELLSKPFVREVEAIFKNHNQIILASIPCAIGRPIPVLESIREDPNNEIIDVTLPNRIDMPDILFEKIMNLHS